MITMSEMATTDTETGVPRRLESPEYTPAMSEISLCKEKPGDESTYVTDIPRRLESAEDTPALSEISLCKEKPSDESSYVVEKYDDRDNAGYVSTWKERVHRLMPLTSMIAICAYWLYFAFRIRYTAAAQQIGHTVYPVAWIFIGIEFGVACEPLDVSQLHSFECLLIRIS